MPSVFSGRIDPNVHPAYVVLRWHGGSKTLAMHSRYRVAHGCPKTGDIWRCRTR